MASPLIRRYKQSSELLLLCVAEVPDFLTCISEELVSQIPIIVHDMYKDLARYVVHSQGHGITTILENMEAEGQDIDDVLKMEDALFDDGASPSQTVHALFSTYEKVKACNSASDYIEAVESCDPTREILAKDMVVRSLGAGVSDTEVKAFDFETSEIEESVVIDRSEFDKTHTPFDTWQILGPEELGILMSPPSVGKTSALVAIGGGMVSYNEGELFHFSAENTLNQMIRKYASNLLSRPNLNSDQIRSGMVKMRKHMKGNLHIECYAPGTVSVDFLQNRVERIMEEKNKDKVQGVLLDYCSLLKAVSQREARHEQLAQIIVACKAMATHFGCPVWTGAQPQRSPSKAVSEFKAGSGPVNMNQSFEAPVLTMEDAGECWAYAQVADYMVTINQTIDERQKAVPEVRLFNAKSREPRADAPINKTTNNQFDYATCTVV